MNVATEKEGSIKNKKLKKTNFNTLKDKIIGKIGTKDRDQYESSLLIERLGEELKAQRQKRNLTQSQLGDRMGVKKAQVSKLEKDMSNASIYTVIKAFKALNSLLLIEIVPASRTKSASHKKRRLPE